MSTTLESVIERTRLAYRSLSWYSDEQHVTTHVISADGKPTLQFSEYVLTRFRRFPSAFRIDVSSENTESSKLIAVRAGERFSVFFPQTSTWFLKDSSDATSFIAAFNASTLGTY